MTHDSPPPAALPLRIAVMSLAAEAWRKLIHPRGEGSSEHGDNDLLEWAAAVIQITGISTADAIRMGQLEVVDEASSSTGDAAPELEIQIRPDLRLQLDLKSGTTRLDGILSQDPDTIVAVTCATHISNSAASFRAQLRELGASVVLMNDLDAVLYRLWNQTILPAASKELREASLHARPLSRMAPFRQVLQTQFVGFKITDWAAGTAQSPEGEFLFDLHVAAISPALVPLKSAAAAKRRCLEVLEHRMRASPAQPTGTKTELFTELNRQLGISRRAFDSEWDRAVNSTGAQAWSAPGRRSSS